MTSKVIGIAYIPVYTGWAKNCILLWCVSIKLVLADSSVTHVGSH